MEKKRVPDSEAGFTLVELLVSFVVLSFIAIFLANGLTFGARVWERRGLVLENAQEVEAVQSVLRRQIEGAYPGLRGEGSSRVVDFEGSDDEMTYRSKLPRAFGEGGFVRTRLSIKQTREGSDLMIAWCMDERESDCVSKILLGDIKSAAFTYFDAEKQAPLVRWRGRSTLPDLISVAVEFAEGDRRVWPDLAAAPGIDREAGCRFDPVSKRCRRI